MLESGKSQYAKVIPQELLRIFPSAGFSQNANVELWLCGDFHQPTQLSLKKRELCHLAFNIASFISYYCNLSNLRSIKCLSLVDGPRDWSVSPKRLVDLSLKWFLHRKCWGETTMKVKDVDVFLTYSDILTRYSITANHIRIPGVSWCPCNWVSAQWSCQVLSESSCPKTPTNGSRSKLLASFIWISAITMPGIATHHGPTIRISTHKKNQQKQPPTAERLEVRLWNLDLNQYRMTPRLMVPGSSVCGVLIQHSIRQLTHGFVSGWYEFWNDTCLHFICWSCVSCVQD